MNTLPRWTLPEHYFGAEWPEYFVFLTQNRDSDSLGRANFTSGLDAIGGETETVFIVRESHFLCGWLEWIAIHESDTEALEKASDVMAELENYPCLDEEAWSANEYEEACQVWQDMSVRDRVELLQKFAGYSHKPSIFAARRAELPDGLPYYDDLIGH